MKPSEKKTQIEKAEGGICSDIYNRIEETDPVSWEPLVLEIRLPNSWDTLSDHSQARVLKAIKEKGWLAELTMGGENPQPHYHSDTSLRLTEDNGSTEGV